MNESKTVVLFFGDEEYGLFESRHLFGDYFLTIIDDEVVISTLKPSERMPGKFELDREILSLQYSPAVASLDISRLTAPELLHVIAIAKID